MSGLSISGTGLSVLIPLAGGTYGGGLTALPGLPLFNTASTANPATGLVLRGSGFSQTAVAAAPWVPTDLGTDLYAWWDAEQASTITESAGAVSAWRDVVGSYSAAQAGAGKPVYSATSFNGRPGVTGNGTTQELTYAATTGLPTSGTPCEAWAALDQTIAGADATTRILIGWGGVASLGNIVLRRTSVASVNRGSIAVGNNTTSIASTAATFDFSGRHVMRGISSGTDCTVVIDATVGATNAVVPLIGTTRLRLFAGTANTAANFWQGVLNTVLITKPLAAGPAANLYAYLSARL